MCYWICRYSTPLLLPMLLIWLASKYGSKRKRLRWPTKPYPSKLNHWSSFQNLRCLNLQGSTIGETPINTSTISYRDAVLLYTVATKRHKYCTFSISTRRSNLHMVCKSSRKLYSQLAGNGYKFHWQIPKECLVYHKSSMTPRAGRNKTKGEWERHGLRCKVEGTHLSMPSKVYTACIATTSGIISRMRLWPRSLEVLMTFVYRPVTWKFISTSAKRALSRVVGLRTRPHRS